MYQIQQKSTEYNRKVPNTLESTEKITVNHPKKIKCRKLPKTLQ